MTCIISHMLAGSVFHVMGDLLGAKLMYKRALAIVEKFLPPDHPDIKTIKGNIENLKK